MLEKEFELKAVKDNTVVLCIDMVENYGLLRFRALAIELTGKLDIKTNRIILRRIEADYYICNNRFGQPTKWGPEIIKDNVLYTAGKSFTRTTLFNDLLNEMSDTISLSKALKRLEELGLEFVEYERNGKKIINV